MKNTIRGRIIGIFLVCLILVLALTGYHLWNIFSLRERFDLVEEFYRLFNNVLEVRRYEKNYIIYRDPEDLSQASRYLDRTRSLAEDLSEDIDRVVGPDSYAKFKSDMDAYGKLLLAPRAAKKGAPAFFDEASARRVGKELVDFSHNLLIIKRKRIHAALQRTLTIPLAFLGAFGLLLYLVGQLVSRNILRPLRVIRRTTDEVAKGNFAPIPYQTKSKDEVSSLVAAFNRMSQEIEARQEQLVQTRKMAAIGTFTSGVAHELNNPINNIRLTAESLLDDVENLNTAETSELCLDILSQADRAGDIVKNLLTFSRLDRPDKMDLSVEDVLESTFKLVRNQIMVDGITLQSTIPRDLPRVRGNLRNLQQVFLNLLLNAVQAMPGGGQIKVLAGLENEYVRIDVSDTGTGIKPEDLEHIFDPFYTTKDVGQGTGLGLSVTYGLVEKHGGYIEVKSGQGQGTTFSVYLPQMTGEEVEG